MPMYGLSNILRCFRTLSFISGTYSLYSQCIFYKKAVNADQERCFVIFEILKLKSSAGLFEADKRKGFDRLAGGG